MRALLSTVAVALVAATVPAAAPMAAPVNAVAAAPSSGLVLPRPKAGRAKPLIVVVAENNGAETTDFTIPYGVLKDSGVAEVRSLSTEAGPVKLRMALKIMADATIGQFDAQEPAGADIVVVPAQMSPKDKILIAFVRAQAAKGAVIVSICEGARVLAHAGLLEGRQAATHWSAIKSLEKDYPQTRWVRDRRYVQDGPIISTTGVSASIPASLAIVEAIGGQAVAAETARRLGVSDWSPLHRTADFALAKGDVSGAVGTALAFWSHETVEFPLTEGVDEVALALQADAWSRTFRSKVVSTSATAGAVSSRHGLKIVPDAKARPGRYVVTASSGQAVRQLDASLAEMHRRYGPAAVRLARLGMEYDGSAPTP